MRRGGWRRGILDVEYGCMSRKPVAAKNRCCYPRGIALGVQAEYDIETRLGLE